MKKQKGFIYFELLDSLLWLAVIGMISILGISAYGIYWLIMHVELVLS